MGKIWYQQGHQNCSSERGLFDDPVKNNLARHCKILKKGEGLARRLNEKNYGMKENIARSVERGNRRRPTRKG
jgi:hypothetical protein